MKVGSHVYEIFFISVLEFFDCEIVFGDVAGLEVPDVIEEADLIHEGVDGAFGL